MHASSAQSNPPQPPTTIFTLMKPSKPEIETRMPPALPAVQTDTALAIFAHTSVRSPEQNNHARRLAFLGEKVLRMVTAETLFEKKPMLDAASLDTEFETALSNTGNFYEQWVSFYKLRDKVTRAADRRGELEKPGTSQHLFDAYVGAVYSEQGYSSVKAWIQPLVDLNSGSTSNRPSNGAPTGSSSPPKSPSNSSDVTGAFLAMFHRTAMQLDVQIKWKAVQWGTAHAPTWKIKCIVDGVVRGTGVGKNKQQAKEEAARQAQQALGWAKGA